MKAKREQNLSTDEVRRITFARAVRLLTAKPRSIAELREKLLKSRTAKEEDVEAAVDRLKEYGYLDDERFAYGYASLKVKQKPIGRKRLERDLKFKKIDSGTAEEALDLVFDETSEEELIDLAIEKRLRLRGRPKNSTESKSLFDHLLRRGFPFELVSEKVRSVSQSDLDENEGSDE
jgi:regulatory protein